MRRQPALLRRGASLLPTRGTCGTVLGRVPCLSPCAGHGARALPFFIERGVGYDVQLKNSCQLDNVGLLAFLLFWIAIILQPDSVPAAGLVYLLCILHTQRMAGWYTPRIQRQPLLWFFSPVTAF